MNLLMGGYNPATSKTELHYMDYLAASVPVSYYAFGYGGMFTLSIMDQEYRSGNYHLRVLICTKVLCHSPSILIDGHLLYTHSCTFLSLQQYHAHSCNKYHSVIDVHILLLLLLYHDHLYPQNIITLILLPIFSLLVSYIYQIGFHIYSKLYSTPSQPPTTLLL